MTRTDLHYRRRVLNANQDLAFASCAQWNPAMMLWLGDDGVFAGGLTMHRNAFVAVVRFDLARTLAHPNRFAAGQGASHLPCCAPDYLRVSAHAAASIRAVVIWSPAPPQLRQDKG
jgi:hypothetical protein